MKASRIITKTVLMMLCVLGTITMASAQTPTPPTPPSTTTTASTTNKRSQQKVHINMDGNKLRLKMDNDELDLDMVFDFDATFIINAISDELGSPMKAGRFMIWEGRGYDIKVKNDHLDLRIDRQKLSSSTQRRMEDILMTFFKDLDLEIELS